MATLAKVKKTKGRQISLSRRSKPRVGGGGQISPLDVMRTTEGLTDRLKKAKTAAEREQIEREYLEGGVNDVGRTQNLMDFYIRLYDESGDPSERSDLYNKILDTEHNLNRLRGEAVLDGYRKKEGGWQDIENQIAIARRHEDWDTALKLTNGLIEEKAKAFTEALQFVADDPLLSGTKKFEYEQELRNLGNDADAIVVSYQNWLEEKARHAEGERERMQRDNKYRVKDEFRTEMAQSAAGFQEQFDKQKDFIDPVQYQEAAVDYLTDRVAAITGQMQYVYDLYEAGQLREDDAVDLAEDYYDMLYGSQQPTYIPGKGTISQGLLEPTDLYSSPAEHVNAILEVQVKKDEQGQDVFDAVLRENPNLSREAALGEAYQKLQQLKKGTLKPVFTAEMSDTGLEGKWEFRELRPGTPDEEGNVDQWFDAETGRVHVKLPKAYVDQYAPGVLGQSEDIFVELDKNNPDVPQMENFDSLKVFLPKIDVDDAGNKFLGVEANQGYLPKDTEQLDPKHFDMYNWDAVGSSPRFGFKDVTKGERQTGERNLFTQVSEFGKQLEDVTKKLPGGTALLGALTKPSPIGPLGSFAQEVGKEVGKGALSFFGQKRETPTIDISEQLKSAGDSLELGELRRMRDQAGGFSFFRKQQPISVQDFAKELGITPREALVGSKNLADQPKFQSPGKGLLDLLGQAGDVAQRGFGEFRNFISRKF